MRGCVGRWLGGYGWVVGRVWVGGCVEREREGEGEADRDIDRIDRKRYLDRRTET